ncbi:recombinase family protein [Planctomycetota bacterium]
MVSRQNSRTSTSTAVGYVRRSTDRQEQSIDDQKKAITSYASDHALRLHKFYVDDAISGTSVLHRQAFQQLIEDAQSKARAFGSIVVYDIKRFGRVDNDEAGYYRHILRSHGVSLHYVSENFTGDTTDDLLRPVKQWQARQESKDLSQVTIRGLLSKVETGTWMGGIPPYGYDLRYESGEGQFLLILRFMADGSKQILDKQRNLVRTIIQGESLTISRRDSARLVLSEPGRVALIKRIFHLYTQVGKGFKAIAYTLNHEGIPAPRSPKWSAIYSGKWTDTTVRAIIVNPLYVGDMVWNRRRDGRFHKIRAGHAVDREGVYGARLVPNNESDWITVRDTHEPIIKRRLFEQAKQRRLANVCIKHNPNHGKSWQGKRSAFILSGLMTCELCGSRYQGVTSNKGRKSKDGSTRKHRYYGCGGYITKGTAVCSKTQNIRKKALEEAVIGAVLGYYQQYQGKAGHQHLRASVKAQVGSEGKEMVAAQKRATREKHEITQTINNLLDNITETNRDLVDKRLTELKSRLRDLDARLTELDRLITSQGQIKELVSEAKGFLSNLKDVLSEGEPHEKLMLMRQCIKKIKVNRPKDSITIEILVVPAGGLVNSDILNMAAPE